MAPVIITDETHFNKIVLQSTKPVIVDFFATWCGPCKRMSPIVDQFALDNPNIVVVKVDVDKSSDLASKYNISSIPTFVLFNKGQHISQLSATSKIQLQQLLGLLKA